jgi:hypothetical protein
MSDIKKRMAHVKAAMRCRPVYLKSERRRVEEHLKSVGADPKVAKIYDSTCFTWTGEHDEALKRAKKYFEVDSDHHVALAMAMVLFGPQEKGRARGMKTCTPQQYLNFAEPAPSFGERTARSPTRRSADA